MPKTLANVFPHPPHVLLNRLKDASNSLLYSSTILSEAKIFLVESKMRLLYFKSNVTKMELDEIDTFIAADQQMDKYDELFILNFGGKIYEKSVKDADDIYSSLYQRYKNI